MRAMHLASVYCRQRRLRETFSQLPDSVLNTWRTNDQAMKATIGFSTDDIDDGMYREMATMSDEELVEFADTLDQILEALS